MAMWLRAFEAWATARLLASPAFHRAVHNVHRRMRYLREGKPPEEMGGTNLEGPSESKKLLQYFVEELKDQLRRQPKR